MINEKTISALLKPLVISGLYKNEASALKDIIANYIEEKIKIYDNTIKKMQNKYDKTFDSFTGELKGKASIDNEDDWMEWKASILLRESWHETLKGLLKNAA